MGLGSVFGRDVAYRRVGFLRENEIPNAYICVRIIRTLQQYDNIGGEEFSV